MHIMAIEAASDSVPASFILFSFRLLGPLPRSGGHWECVSAAQEGQASLSQTALR